jgi:hypothetical protein
MAVLSATAIRATERPVTTRSRGSSPPPWGVARMVALPPWLEVTVAVVLLDYTLYVWHVLTHRVPFLWRFHDVHHADRDLDASTALRFHFGEMILSVPWRAGQIVAIGAHTARTFDLADAHARRDPLPPLERPSPDRGRAPPRAHLHDAALHVSTTRPSATRPTRTGERS